MRGLRAASATETKLPIGTSALILVGLSLFSWEILIYTALEAWSGL